MCPQHGAVAGPVPTSWTLNLLRGSAAQWREVRRAAHTHFPSDRGTSSLAGPAPGLTAPQQHSPGTREERKVRAERRAERREGEGKLRKRGRSATRAKTVKEQCSGKLPTGADSEKFVAEEGVWRRG